MSDSFRPHEPQHARPPCPSPTPGVYPNSCPSSRWCHPAVSSSVIPFSFSPKSLPVSESFPVSQLFTWGGQSIRVSALASVLPMNTKDWSPLEWNGGFPCSSRDSQESSPTPQFKSINFSVLSIFYGPTLTSIHDHWKHHSFDNMDLSQQMMSLFILSPEATFLVYSQQGVLHLIPGGPSCCISLLCPLEGCISSAFPVCL